MESDGLDPHRAMLGILLGDPEVFHGAWDPRLDPNGGVEGRRFVHHAARAACSDPRMLGVLRTLLEAGADPNLPDEEGHPPLRVMAGLSHSPGWDAAAEALCSAGADPDLPCPDGDSPQRLERMAASFSKESILRSEDRWARLRSICEGSRIASGASAGRGSVRPKL